MAKSSQRHQHELPSADRKIADPNRTTRTEIEAVGIVMGAQRNRLKSLEKVSLNRFCPKEKLFIRV